MLRRLSFLLACLLVKATVQIRIEVQRHEFGLRSLRHNAPPVL
jgi:hypothetical protein